MNPEQPSSDGIPAPPELPGLPARYAVSRLLGRGSEKAVYLAEDTKLERRVAISAVDAEPVSDRVQVLLQEARTMARIGDWPHLVSVYDVIETEAALYVVNQYLPGGDLARRLETQESLSLRQAARLGAQVCQALEHAHSNVVAHGDVKPGNVFFDERGDAYLGDFGFARIAGARGATAAGARIGSLAYAPPEQIWGALPTPAGDLYGLGSVLYELATGTLPFAARDPSELLRLKDEGHAVAPAQRNPEIPLVLSDLILKLLEKEPARRPSSSGEVRAALESILASGLRAHEAESAPRSSFWIRNDHEPRGEPQPEPPLIQREREIATLRRVVQKALAGDPRLVLICGEPGVGKSRLLGVLRGLAERMGCVSLVGHGHEDAPQPYRPFVEALMPLAARIGELSEHDAGALRRFLHIDPPSADRPNVGGADRQHLFLALSRALQTFAATRPLVLLIDDLQWADRTSLQLFEHLSRSLSQGVAETDPRIALVGAFRTSSAPDDPALRIFARLRTERICEHLEISPLSETGTYELLQSLGIRRPAHRVVGAIHEVTQGNPLFLREVVELLNRRGSLDHRDGFATATLSLGDLELPASLRLAVEARARALSEPCRRLLTLASFIGSRFELRSLIAVAGHSEEVVIERLEEALRHQLLHDEGEAFQFSHPLVRQVFYREPSKARRRRIHLQIAEQLQERNPRDRPLPVLEIAHHLVRAGPAADQARVSQYARLAAQHALANFAWSEAASLLEAAIGSAEASGSLSSVERAELRLDAAISYHHAYDAGPSLAHYQAAIDAFEAADDSIGRARALEGKLSATLQLGLLSYGQLGDVGPVEEALADLEESDPALRARIQGTLAGAYWAAQQADKGETLAERALELAQTAGDERLCAEISAHLALSRLQKMEPAGALAAWERGLDHARRASDLVREESCLQRIPMPLFILGRVSEAERTVREAQDLSRTVQNAASVSLNFANLASLACLRGDFDAAEQHARDGIASMRRAGYGWSGLLILPALACARALRGAQATADEAIDLMIQPGFVFDDPGFCVESVGRYHKLIDVYCGNRIERDDGAPSFMGSDAHPFGLDFASITPLCAEVELAWYSGSDALPPSAHKALELADRRHMVFSIAWPFMIPRLRGMAAASARQWDDAGAHFEKAIGLADRLGITTEMGRARLEYAWMLADLEDESARERARELLRSAMRSLRVAKLEGFQRRAIDLSSRLDVSLD